MSLFNARPPTVRSPMAMGDSGIFMGHLFLTREKTPTSETKATSSKMSVLNTEL